MQRDSRPRAFLVEWIDVDSEDAKASDAKRVALLFERCQALTSSLPATKPVAGSRRRIGVSQRLP